MPMQNDYRQLFLELDEKEPPAELFHDTMLRINAKQKRSATFARIGFFGTASLLALFVFVPTVREFYAEFMQSGFSQFASLIFSDMGILAKYWQDFLLSLAESLPVLSAIGVIASLFVFLLSTERLIRNVRALTRSSIVAI